MGAVTVRRLDDGTIERIKAKAKANHRSMEEEIRDALTRTYAEPLRGQAAADYFAAHRQRAFGGMIVEGAQEALRWSRYGVEEDDDGPEAS